MPAGIDESYYGFLADAPWWTTGDFALFAGDTIQGRIFPASDFDSYFLFLSPELTYTITATSSFGPPPRFTIDNAGMFPMAVSQISGNTSTLTFTGDKADAATYFTISGTTGSIYTATLSVSGVTETSGIGENISTLSGRHEASLDFLSDVDHFTVNAIAGHTYRVAIDTAIPDLAVRFSLAQPTGTLHVPLIEVSEGIFEFTPNVAGAFDLSFRSETFRGEGSYSFGIRDMTPANNLAPVADEMVQNLRVLNNATRAIVVNGQDGNGDPITYTFTDPQHGTVERDADGRFIYTAFPDYFGMDHFRITLTDSEGGSSVQDVNLFVADAVANERWRLLAPQEFSSEIVGTGSIFGTSSKDDVTILPGIGIITFDPSFNGGGDTIRLPGQIADWEVVQVGSGVELTNGEMVAVIPVGVVGATIGFDDGSASLLFDRGTRSIMLGAQVVTTSLEPVVVVNIDGPGLDAPTMTDDIGRLLFSRTFSTVTLGGQFDIFGNGSNSVEFRDGTFTLDPSFNDGNDSLALSGMASDYTVRLFGSSAVFESDTTSVTVPVSPNETFLQVIDGSGTLFLDTTAGKVYIGNQEITAAEATLTFA